MAAKPLEWHQALYAILGKYCDDEGDVFDLHEAQIVRTVDGSYRLAKDAFFQTGVPSKKDPLPRIDEEILTVGTRKGQQSDARKFLVSIGVAADAKLTHPAEVNLTHLVEADGLLAVDVDPGASSGDTSDGPQGRGCAGDCAAAGLLAQHRTPVPA